MLSDEFIYIFRLINVGLSFACLLSMGARLPEFIAQPLYLRLERLALGMIVAVGGFGIIEVLVRHQGGGWRVPMMTVALIFLLVSLSINGPKKQDGPDSKERPQ